MPYCWISEQMREHQKKIGEHKPLFAKLADGSIAEYTLETIDDTQPHGWSDVKLVGQGEFHSEGSG